MRGGLCPTAWRSARRSEQPSGPQRTVHVRRAATTNVRIVQESGGLILLPLARVSDPAAALRPASVARRRAAAARRSEISPGERRRPRESRAGPYAAVESPRRTAEPVAAPHRWRISPAVGLAIAY